MGQLRLYISFLFILCVSIPFTNGQVKYYDADEFPLIGKTSIDTETRYERLPSHMKEVSRRPVWSLGKNTAGLAIRFRTNSTSVSAKWTVLFNKNMNHMTDIAVKGLDLYAWVDNQWRFVNSARPEGKDNEVKIIDNMTPAGREYMLFLPLYDGVVKLEVGVDSLASIEQPALNTPDTSNPIIVYGTSITQGGCATRPGMAYTNILTRRLNKEVINLGFSGNGKLDYEIAEIMAQRKDASLYILDCLPNVSVELIQERLIPFIDIIRAGNANAPILLVENIQYPTTIFDQEKDKTWKDKNIELSKHYEYLKDKGYKNIFYMSCDNLIGVDGEGTVDGTHLTDLGFIRFADILGEEIKKLLENPKTAMQ